jgi:hypothetical protein
VPYPYFDYLALAPELIVAATPLILGWLEHLDKDKGKNKDN